MIFSLMLRGLRRGKARFACAVAGIAIAVGSLVFVTSLVATNNAQAPYLARKACAPWSAWSLEGVELGFRRGGGANNKPTTTSKPGDRPRGDLSKPGDRPRGDLELAALRLTIDYRPGGHVLQGPPMMALMAEAPAENPYGAVKLTEGRWVTDSAADCEVVCVRSAMKRFGRMKEPALGENIKFIGENGTMTAKIVGYLDGDKLPSQFPGVFANKAAFSAFVREKHGKVAFFKTIPGACPQKNGACPQKKLLTAESDEVVASFKADEQRRMDYATPLLLVAAFLTALSLLVNSLLLSVESNRAELGKLRMVGLTRGGVVLFVFYESLFAAVVGWAIGAAVAALAIKVWVLADAAAFPAGAVVSLSRLGLTAAVLPLVVLLAVLFTLAPALKVRPMDESMRRPRSRRSGMAITFACGFAAFVAVEVWGASLMRGFVPSPEWPDAIVSILPGGVSSYDVEKLRTVKGVRRISELVPRQCLFPGEAPTGGKTPPFRGAPNALFLAAEWLPKFRFIEGTWEEADRAVRSGDAVVITEMMSNAHRLHKGDTLVVRTRRRGPGAFEELRFPIAGVVDLNWHMVTSRGLVRGLNGMPGMTDGPVFCSLDTVGIVDPRTYMTEPVFSAPMTHLWVEYEPAFLQEHGVFQAGRLIESEIAKRLGNPTGSTVRLHARDEIADGTLAHGTDIIGQAARVPFVFLAILAIGFVAMLVAEADARRREFAVLRAVGATSGQVAANLAASAVRTALVGVAAGFPVGALLGWLVSLKTAAMWPGMPHWFVIPWQVTIEGALGALVFALIFAVPTAVRLSRARRGEKRRR